MFYLNLMISSEKIHIDIQERERNQRMSLWKDSKRRRKRATIKHPENNEEDGINMSLPINN